MIGYGNCPICGADGVMRERQINGDDICANSHRYPSRTAVYKDTTKDKVDMSKPTTAIYRVDVYLEQIGSNSFHFIGKPDKLDVLLALDSCEYCQERKDGQRLLVEKFWTGKEEEQCRFAGVFVGSIKLSQTVHAYTATATGNT